MKPRIIILLLCCLGLALPLTVCGQRTADAQVETPMSSKEIASVRFYLQFVDNPYIRISQCAERLKSPEFRRSFLAYYRAGTNAFSPRAKLLLGMGLARDQHYPEAIKLTEEYRKAFPKDCFGVVYLGTYLIEIEAYGQAIEVLKTDVKPDGMSEEEFRYGKWAQQVQLAYAAMLAGRLDLMKRTIPTLVGATSEQLLTDENINFRTVSALTVYAIATRDQNLFSKVARMEDMAKLPIHNIAAEFILVGCNAFPSLELATVRLALLRDAAKTSSLPTAAPWSPITGEDIELVQSRIRENEAGRIDLYSMADEAFGTKFIAYCENTTNRIPTKAKLALSRCIGRAGRLSEAIKLAEEYVQVYSNDWRGWRIIGVAAYNGHDFAKALAPLEKGVKLGGVEGEELHLPLADCAYKMGRMDILDTLVPSLIKLRQSAEIPEAEKQQITLLLVLHSFDKNDPGLFVKGLEGITMDQILADNSLRVSLLMGWNLFHPKKVAPLWKAYQAAAYRGKPESK